ncbi:MAG: hypothetical protein KDC12_08385 [Flavobacteriales bacterium]|nr:hypothetical protein [Flavobacteriales bacterium]
MQCTDSAAYRVLAAEYGHSWECYSYESHAVFQINRLHDTIVEYRFPDSTIVLHLTEDRRVTKHTLQPGESEYASIRLAEEAVKDSLGRRWVTLRDPDLSLVWTFELGKSGIWRMPYALPYEGTVTGVHGSLGNAAFTYISHDFDALPTHFPEPEKDSLLDVFTLWPAYDNTNLLVYSQITGKDIFSDSIQIDSARVVVVQDKAVMDTLELGADNHLSLELPLQYDYHLIYEAPGFARKEVWIDTRNIEFSAANGGFLMDLDISLQKAVEGLDLSVFDEPVGKARYNHSTENIEFDLKFTQNRMDQIEGALDSQAH